MLQQGEIHRLTARNHRCRHRNLKSGHIWLLEAEVEREDWDVLDEIPEGAMIEVAVFYHFGDDPEIVEKAEKKLKGQFGLFWREMCRKGLLNHFDLREALNDPDGDASDTKKALYREFEVGSLSAINPTDFARWAESKQLHSLVVMANQVAVSQQ